MNCRLFTCPELPHLVWPWGEELRGDHIILLRVNNQIFQDKTTLSQRVAETGSQVHRTPNLRAFLLGQGASAWEALSFSGCVHVCTVCVCACVCVGEGGGSLKEILAGDRRVPWQQFEKAKAQTS